MTAADKKAITTFLAHIAGSITGMTISVVALFFWGSWLCSLFDAKPLPLRVVVAIVIFTSMGGITTPAAVLWRHFQRESK